MTAIKLTEIKPETLSDIKVQYKLGSSRINNDHEILAISFSGKYGIGSAGNDDAEYMFAKGQFGLHAIFSYGVVIDFRELEYEWGDMIEDVFSIKADIYFDKTYPRALVVGEKCKTAIGTLLHGIDSKEPATSIEWIFDSFEEAWEYIENEIEKRMTKIEE